MKKIIAVIASLIFLSIFITSCSKHGHKDSTLQEIKLTAATMDGASISDSGHAIVYREKRGPINAIYLSKKLSKKFMKPNLVVNTYSKIEGYPNLKFISFFKKQYSQQATNFNGPQTNGVLVTFAATVKNSKNQVRQGVFFARPFKHGYQILPIAITDTPTAKNKYFFQSVEAPYISNGVIYFIAKNAKGIKGVYGYTPKTGIFSFVNENKQLNNFWDLSVNHRQFALRATDQNGQQGIYVWNAKQKKLIKFSINQYDGSNQFKLGGPSLFQGKIAYMVFYKKNNEPQYAIYSNARGITEQVASTNHQPNKFRFDNIGNPTLSIEKKVAHITFSSTNSNNINSVYIATIKPGKPVMIKPLLAADSSIGTKTVENVRLGPVSIRRKTIPLIAVFADNLNGLYVEPAGITE